MYPNVPKHRGTQEVVVQKHKRTLTFVVGAIAGGVSYVSFARHKKKQLKEEDIWYPGEAVTEEGIVAWVNTKLTSLATEEPSTPVADSMGYLRQRHQSRPHVGGGPHSGGKNSKKHRRQQQRYHNSPPVIVPGAPQSMVISDDE